MLALEARDRVGDLDLAVDLDVGTGETLALAGPSGAGKTTVLRIAAGLRRPATGTVRCGEDVWLDTSAAIDMPVERRRAGYLFQSYALFPNLSGWENVAYGLRDLARGERRRRADELLERFDVAHLAERRPATWSGGERQRVALARALAPDPRLLLLDEPLAALDTRTRAHAARELAAILAGADVPALLVTHDFEEAAVLADRVAVIDAGRVVQVGSAAELVAAPASAFVADLTGAVVLAGRARPGADGLTEIALDGGGTVVSSAPGEGTVALAVHPWEIALERPAAVPGGASARNRLPATVASVTPLGNRVRVGLVAAQPISAELTAAAADELALAPGVPVIASWKATATRVVAR
jgi:molybdate transport system ATP-binding protein